MTSAYLKLAQALLPEAALVVGALLVLAYDLTAGRKAAAALRLRVAAVIGAAAVVVSLYLSVVSGIAGPVFGHVLMIDQLAFASRLGVLLLAGLTLFMLPGSGRRAHPAEFVAVLLLATVGFLLMAAAQQLLLAFLALELASLALYALAGFDKTRPESAEAGLKYFLFGGMSAAFLLFGFSLIYGLTGSIELPEISRQLAALSPSPLLIVALVMVLVGFGYKAAAAPFHLWAPDVYQGAPAPAAALIASASKLAGFTLLMRLFWPGFGAVAGSLAAGTGYVGWLPVVMLLAAASLLIGNLGALAQSNVRRLLAYSAIAHAGIMLLGVLTAGLAGPGPVYYYALTYGLATVGAFGVIGVVDQAGGCQSLSDLAGLHKRSPLLAGCLFVFILSLAGVPPLAGFFGKFAVFAEALRPAGLSSPAGWLAFLGIAMSAVGLYYYLLILKHAFVVPAEKENQPIQIPLGVAVALLAAAGLVIALGFAPSAILSFFG